jgi:signal transduction histidine kinase
VAKLDVHSFAVVPIRARRTIIGALSVLRSRAGLGYTPDDVTLIGDLADRAGLAIENARLYDDLERRVRERTAQLETLNNELEAFSHTVAHDLRAPLRGIDGFSAVLMQRCAERLAPEDLKIATRIRDSARRMAQLVDALLNLSKVTSAQLKRRRVDLSGAASAVLDRLAEGDGARIVAATVQPDMVVNADPQLVDAVLSNLIGNAWKFTGKRAEPRIEIGASGRRTPVYFVRDNGAGFPQAHAAKLFRPFERLHAPREFEGTGIGLATVQRIVRRHGGRVWAEGKVNGGATFYFTLEAEPP